MDEGTVVLSSFPGPIRPGTRLNDNMFEIVSLLGEGGLSKVYRGINVSTGGQVAIKFLDPEKLRDVNAMALFRREAEILSTLHHDAIVRYFTYAFDSSVGREYLVMELVQGVSLKKRLASGALSLEETMHLKTRIAGGLETAHRLGVVHRDMSPDNIILPGGDVRAAKIIDFGIAKAKGMSQGTVIGDGFAGKYLYASPEQVGEREVTLKSDIYSFGLVLAEAIRGAPLDMGGRLDEIFAKRARPPDLSDIDSSIRPLLLSMLQPAQDARPGSMGAVAAWPEGAGNKEYSGDTERRRNSGREFGGWAAAVGVVIMLGSLGGAGYVFRADIKALLDLAPNTSGTASVTPAGPNPQLAVGTSKNDQNPPLTEMLGAKETLSTVQTQRSKETSRPVDTQGAKQTSAPVDTERTKETPFTTDAHGAKEPPASDVTKVTKQNLPAFDARRGSESLASDAIQEAKPTLPIVDAERAEETRALDRKQEAKPTSPAVDALVANQTPAAFKTQDSKETAPPVETQAAKGNPPVFDKPPGAPQTPTQVEAPYQTAASAASPAVIAKNEVAGPQSKTELGSVGAFLSGYDAGGCVLARPLTKAVGGKTVELVSSDPEAFARFAEDFRRSVGEDPRLLRTKVDGPVCPTLQLVKIGRDGFAAAPRIELEFRTVGPSAPVAGHISGLIGRAAQLVVVKDDGVVFAIPTKSAGPDAATFRMEITSVDQEDLGRSLALLAIVSDKPLSAVTALGARRRKGDPPPQANELVSKLLADWASTRAAADVQFVTLSR